MNCALCMDHKFLCETCSQLTPWPCPLEHDCSMPCPQCNPEDDAPSGFELTDGEAGDERY